MLVRAEEFNSLSRSTWAPAIIFYHVRLPLWEIVFRENGYYLGTGTCNVSCSPILNRAHEVLYIVPPVRGPHIAGGGEAGESVAAAVTAAQPSGRRHKKPHGQQTFAPDRESDAGSAAAAAFSVFKMSRRQSPLHSDDWEKIVWKVVDLERVTTNGGNIKFIPFVRPKG